MDSELVWKLLAVLALCGALTGALVALCWGFFPGTNHRSNFLRGALAGIPAFLIAIILSFFTTLIAGNTISDIKKTFENRRNARKTMTGTALNERSPTAPKPTNHRPKAPIDEKAAVENIAIRREVEEIVKQANRLSGPVETGFSTSGDGYLKNFEGWNAQWVYFIMQQDGIANLNQEHQKVIVTLRIYYKKNGCAPMVRILSKLTGFKLKHIYERFPSGPGKGACKMPGLPSPAGII